MGRLLINNLHSTGIYDEAKEALASLGQDFDDIANEEDSMGLKNGGLGRLAACFLELARDPELPAIVPVSTTKVWSVPSRSSLMATKLNASGRLAGRRDAHGEIMRPNFSQTIKLYGRVEHQMDDGGNFHPVWVDYKTLEGVPFDVAIVGYGAETVNFLRLWNQINERVRPQHLQRRWLCRSSP